MINGSINRIHTFLRKLRGHRCLEDYTAEERREMWPPAKSLESKHLLNCRLLENRERILEFMPKNSVCAEIGIFRCEFSELILQITQPSLLHLMDIDPEAIDIARQKFTHQIDNKVVQLHLGDSSEIIRSLRETTFDWVYIDGDHTYQGVLRDLEAVKLRIKPGGFIVLNDYIFFAPSDFAKYGVVEAVNEFCIKYDFEFVFFALQGRMYNDVAIREIKSTAS